jgi:RNA polymerase primary sigma factor
MSYLKLFDRIRDGDQAALQRVVRDNIGLVHVIAKRYRGKAEAGDIVGAGRLALVTAAQRYDARGPMSFKSFSIKWIEKAMRNEISRSELIRTPKDEDLPMTYVSLDAPIEDEEGQESNLHDVIPDTNLVLPDQHAVDKEMLSEVVELPPRERSVLILVFGLGRHSVHTAEAAGQKLGCSLQVVKKLKKRGLQMLKDRLYSKLD